MARAISISDAGTGMRPAELSMTMLTSAIPRAWREGLPAKMTSAIWAPRSARGPCSPRTHAMASAMFDLPDPLGPTITLMPGVNSSVVRSAKDLKPRTVRDRRNTSASDANGQTGPNPGIGSRNHTGGTSPGDPELRLSLGWFLLQLHALDPGPAGALAAPLDHGLDGFRVPFERSLHPSVVQVPDEPADPAAHGLFAAVPAKPDPLDVARDEDPHPFLRLPSLGHASRKATHVGLASRRPGWGLGLDELLRVRGLDLVHPSEVREGRLLFVLGEGLHSVVRHGHSISAIERVRAGVLDADVRQHADQHHVIDAVIAEQWVQARFVEHRVHALSELRLTLAGRKLRDDVRPGRAGHGVLPPHVQLDVAGQVGVVHVGHQPVVWSASRRREQLLDVRDDPLRTRVGQGAGDEVVQHVAHDQGPHRQRSSLARSDWSSSRRISSIRSEVSGLPLLPAPPAWGRRRVERPPGSRSRSATAPATQVARSNEPPALVLPMREAAAETAMGKVLPTNFLMPSGCSVYSDSGTATTTRITPPFLNQRVTAAPSCVGPPNRPGMWNTTLTDSSEPGSAGGSWLS